MRKLVLIFISTLLISCSTGWNDNDVKEFHNYCPMGNDFCSCILEAAQDRYSSFREFEKAGEKKSKEEKEWMKSVQKNCKK